MRTRVVVSLLTLASLLAPPCTHAGAVFELDPRIRRGSDGSYRLPGPLGGHASLDATSGECSMAYLSCEPHAPCGASEAECCPPVIGPGTLPFLIGNPFLAGLAGLLCTPVRLSLLGAGECLEGGGAPEALSFLFLDEDVFTDVERCLACAFGMWGYFMKLVPFPVGCELVFLDSCLEKESTPSLRPLAPVPADYIGTLRAVRDQLLQRSARGQRYIQLYDARSPALVRAVPLRPWVMFQIADALPAWLERLTALLAGQGSTVTITQPMVDELLAILAELEGAADADTAAAIRTERDALDLPSYVGLTAEAALARFEGAGSSGPGPAGPGAGCGTGFAGADCALAELLADDLCGSDAIDAKLLGLIETRVGKARGFLGRAAQGGKPGKVRKLVRRSAKQLQGLKKKVRKASATSASCRSTLDGLIEQRRGVVGALAG